MEDVEVSVRKAVPADVPRVVRQWLTSFKRSRWAGNVPNNLYKQVYSEAIRQLLARGSEILVACNPAHPHIILGFICFEVTPRDQILHYVFLREPYRGFKVSNLLMDAAGFVRGNPFVYTYRTEDSHIVTRHGAKYMPELARRAYAFKQELAEPQEMN